MQIKLFCLQMNILVLVFIIISTKKYVEVCNCINTCLEVAAYKVKSEKMPKTIHLDHFIFSEPFLLENPPSHFFLPENPEEPEFADWAETNVTAQLGGSVFLHCPVINSGDRAVSYPSVSIFCLLLTHFHSFSSSD